MANFLFAYRGGGMASTDAEREASMAAWGAWFGKLGPAIVEPGNPLGASTSVSAMAPVGGRLEADRLHRREGRQPRRGRRAREGLPVFDEGGSIDVYETIEVNL